MRKLYALCLVLVLLGVAVAVSASIPEMYEDQIISVGNVKRIYFHLRRCDDVTQECQWHYFGSSAAEYPPMNGDPVNEYAYVQFPMAFDDLGPDALDTMFDLAVQAGRAREGIEGVGIAAVFTDSYVDSGVSRTMEFHLMTHDRIWYYFGSDPVEHPPLPVGDVTEVAAVQFPRDFSELGAEEADTLYQIGMSAGLRREGIE